MVELELMDDLEDSGFCSRGQEAEAPKPCPTNYRLIKAQACSQAMLSEARRSRMSKIPSPISGIQNSSTQKRLRQNLAG